MYNELIKVPIGESLALANPYKVNPFIILEDGAILLYNELEKIKESDFSYESFCSYISDKYNVELDTIHDDVNIVLDALEFKDETDDTTIENTEKIQEDDTYQYVYRYFTEKNKIFKVFFELTYACNLKCKHCYLGDDVNSFKTNITLDNAKRILDELKEAGVVEVTFTGGECTCHPNFYEIVEYACSKKFVVSILSNGSLMNEDLVEKLVKLPVSHIRISLYGLKEYHDNFVGVKGAFDKSLQALTYLNQRRKGFAAAASVITKQNIHDLKILNKELKSMGIPHSMSPMIYPTVKGDLGPTNLRISKQEIKDLILEGYIDIRGSLCAAGISRLRISPKGNVTPCELFREFPFGNVFEKSFNDILNSEERKHWIYDIRDKIDHSDCADCPNLKYCPRCIGVSYLENGNFLKQSTPGLCQLAEAKIEALNSQTEGVSTCPGF